MGEKFSNFSFTTEAATQTFHHRWITEEHTEECLTCYNQIGRDEPYSQHWLKKDHIKLPMTKQEEAVMDIIDARNVDTFLLCDESSEGDTDDFIYEAMTKTLPDFLRLNFCKAIKLEVNLTIHVNLLTKLWIFESGYLRINNHFDIDDIVDVLMSTMMNKIDNHFYTNFFVCRSLFCTIKFLKINVKRIKFADDETKEMMSLPMRYRLIWETQSSNTKRIPIKSSLSSESSVPEIDLETVTDAYIKHQIGNNGYFPPNIPVNLHCFQKCESSNEVYVVPYHISETKSDGSNRNFVIINDIHGKFQRLYEVKNMLGHEANDDAFGMYACSRCKNTFNGYTRLAIHNQMKCDREITIRTLHPDIKEVYQTFLPLPRNEFNHGLYGMRTKTIMMNKNSIPDECNWSKERSINISNGPCIVISSPIIQGILTKKTKSKYIN